MSAWVHVYAKSNHFYQVGFIESGRSGPVGQPNITWWASFRASTLQFANDDPQQVITYPTFEAGSKAGQTIEGEAGKKYGLFIELRPEGLVMSIFDENAVVLGTHTLPDKSLYVKGGIYGVQASVCVEAIARGEADDVAGLEPFEFSNILLQQPGEYSIDYPVDSFDVELMYHMPPETFGIEHKDGKIRIGNGLPRTFAGTI